MGAVGQADRGRGPRHFLLRDDMLEIAEAEPAILLLDGDPVQAERAHFAATARVGNQSSASILAASGAIRSAAKRRVVSRIASAISPSAKSRPELGHVMLSCSRAALAEGARI